MKRLLIPIFAILLIFSIIGFKRATPHKHKYYLSAVAIFRNEGRILKEWLEYNQMMGVEHFYLYNHMSDDNYQEILKPYIKAGTVELFQWPYPATNHKEWNKIQCRAYRTLIRKKGPETFWLAIIDLDEFILPMQHKNIPDFLKDYEKFGGVAINWQLYGTSNIPKILESQTYLGTLTKKAPKDLVRNKFVKSIVQPKKVKKIRQPHYCKYIKPYFHVTENQIPFPSESYTPTVSIDKIRINHYTHQDEAFFYNEKKRRVLEWFPNAKYPSEDPIFNSVEDAVMQPYVDELERRLNLKAKL